MMKRIIRRILIILGISTGILILFFIWFNIKLQSEIDDTLQLQTQKINDSIYCIKDSYVNIYLIKCDKGYILLDAGNKLEAVHDELSKLRVDENEIVAILLTHSDRDHVAALPLFTNAKVHLSKQEEQMINGEKARLFIFKNKIDCDKYAIVGDNQTLHIGGVNVKCILSPGHTTGSMCYLVNGHYLFTGDNLALLNGKVEPFSDFFNMDTQTQKKYIRKLSRLKNVDYIFTAHHGMTDNFEYAFSDWRNEE